MAKIQVVEANRITVDQWMCPDCSELNETYLSYGGGRRACGGCGELYSIVLVTDM